MEENQRVFTDGLLSEELVHYRNITQITIFVSLVISLGAAVVSL